MAFILGNFSIDEILYGLAQNSDDDILYSLDQLSTAQIEITAESTDITDKKGNVVRTVYTSKAGTFTATNAFLHPQIMNAASGSEIEKASSDNKIQMPKFEIVPAGGKINVAAAKDGTIKVVGLYGNGANSTPMTDAEIAAATDSDKNLTVPAGGTDLPIEYLVKYERDAEDGIKLVNNADDFPNLVKLTLYCSYVDPCDDQLKACYVVIPRFMADPSVTISLDRETQEMDFNGNLNIDYCSTNKALYYIYFDGEDAE